MVIKVGRLLSEHVQPHCLTCQASSYLITLPEVLQNLTEKLQNLKSLVHLDECIAGKDAVGEASAAAMEGF